MLMLLGAESALPSKYANFDLMAKSETHFKEMHNWWCQEQGHAEEKICTTWYKFHGSSSDPAKRTKPSKDEIPLPVDVDAMMDAFCAVGQNAEVKAPCRIRAHKKAYPKLDGLSNEANMARHLQDADYAETMAKSRGEIPVEQARLEL